MSAKVRQAAQALRTRYSNHFGVPLESVVVEEFQNGDRDDARVYAVGYPVWTVGA